MIRIVPLSTRCLALILLTVGLAHAEGDAADDPICTDRPTKSTGPCTVPAGHLQYEADVVSFTHADVGGVRTDTWLFTNPTLKVGLASTVDAELNIAPWEVLRTRGIDGSTTFLRGPGDAFARLKWRFYDDARLTIAASPYVKAPTARHGIGNGAIESGVLIPVNYSLNDQWTLSATPEFDSLKSTDGIGHRFNTSQLVNVGYALPHGVTLSGELWGDWFVDRVRTVRQFSVDGGVAWGITRTLQFDAGVNVGLNRNTPAIQAYVGVAQRF